MAVPLFFFRINYCGLCMIECTHAHVVGYAVGVSWP